MKISPARSAHPSPRLMRTLVVIATSLLLSGTAFAQGGGMELTITDEKGKAIKGASVLAIAESTGDEVGTGDSNKKGLVKMSFPAAGFYSLELSKDGFPDQIGRVEIQDAMTTTLGITLYSEATLTKQRAVDAFNSGVTKIQNVGQEEEALADFMEAAQYDPSLADAHRLSAIIAASLDKLDVAEEAVNNFLKLVPEGMPAVAPAVYAVYRKNGRTAELGPVRDALRASNFANDVAIGVFNDGVKALNGDRPEEAKAAFGEALLLDPQLTVAHRSLAALEFNQQNYAEALPHLGRLLSLSPQHRDGNRMAFFSNAALGNRGDATSAGKAWAAKDKNAPEEIAAKASEYYENGDARDARKFAELAIAVAPDSPYANYTVGRVLAGAGEIAKAKEHLRRFIELDPSHPEASSAQAMLDGL